MAARAAAPRDGTKSKRGTKAKLFQAVGHIDWEGAEFAVAAALAARSECFDKFKQLVRPVKNCDRDQGGN